MAKSVGPFCVGAAIAAVMAGPTPAAAEPAGGNAGATSRATLTIAVSVAPRAGVSWRSDPSATGAAPGQWCAWSTSALRTLFVKLQSTAGHRASTASIRLEAGRSPADCAANDALQRRIAELRASSAGGALLLVAPE